MTMAVPAIIPGAISRDASHHDRSGSFTALCLRIRYISGPPRQTNIQPKSPICCRSGGKKSMRQGHRRSRPGTSSSTADEPDPVSCVVSSVIDHILHIQQHIERLVQTRYRHMELSAFAPVHTIWKVEQPDTQSNGNLSPWSESKFCPFPHRIEDLPRNPAQGSAYL